MIRRGAKWILAPIGVEREVRNMLHWKNRLTLAASAALVVLSAAGGCGWTW
jgi:hypothetical protein